MIDRNTVRLEEGEVDTAGVRGQIFPSHVSVYGPINVAESIDSLKQQEAGRWRCGRRLPSTFRFPQSRITDTMSDKLQKGMAAHKAGDLATAAALYAAHLEMAPSDSHGLYLYGVLSLQSGDPQRGAALLEKALAADVGSARAMYSLGRARALLGDTKLNVKQVVLPRELGKTLLLLEPFQKGREGHVEPKAQVAATLVSIGGWHLPRCVVPDKANS